METIAKHTTAAETLMTLVENTFFSIAQNNNSIQSRKIAIDYAKSLGFPTRKSEDYKYSNPEKLFRDELTIPLDQFNISKVEIAITAAKLNETINLVFVNGFFQKNYSDKIENLGVFISSVKSQLQDSNSDAAKLISANSSPGKDYFAEINKSIFQDGIYISINQDYVLEKPIHIINIIEGEKLFVNTRHVINAKQSSTSTIVETNLNLNESANGISNLLVEIYVLENARLNFYRLQNGGVTDNQITNTKVTQAKNSYFDTNTVSLKSNWIRNNLNIALTGVNCETHLNGLFVTRGVAHVDTHSLVDHQQPHCVSNQLYKGVLYDKGTGVFNGKIHVQRDAQKTNAYQTSKNILMSDDATINAKPELEIYADDVKCSHGSSTGRIDEEALFYLKSRGIGEHTARELLLQAFMKDVIDTVRNEIWKNHLLETLQTL